MYKLITLTVLAAAQVAFSSVSNTSDQYY